MENDQLLHSHFLKAWAIQADYAFKGGHTHQDGLTLTHTGIKVPALNRIFVQNRDTSGLSSGSIRQSMQHFQQALLPYNVCVTEEQEAQLSNIIAELGLEHAYDQPGMALPENIEPPKPKEGFVVAAISNPLHLTQFNTTVSEAYRIPIQLVNLMVSENLLADERCHLLLGITGGAVVSTAAVIDTEEASGLYWVTTHPEHQRKGYGEETTWGAIRHCLERGKRTITLQASEEGIGLYKKMGFVNYTQYRFYNPPTPPTNE